MSSQQPHAISPKRTAASSERCRRADGTSWNVRPRAGAAPRRNHETARQDVEQPAPDQRQQRDQQRLLAHRLPHRQPEDVERDVAPEQRIALAERHAVEEAQPAEPVGRAREPEQDAQHAGARHRERADHPALHRDRAAVLAGTDDDVRAGEGAAGEVEVAEQDQEDGRERRREDHRLRVERPEEHAVVLQLSEPEPVGVVPGDRRHDEQCRDDEQREADADPTRHRRSGCAPGTARLLLDIRLWYNARGLAGRSCNGSSPGARRSGTRGDRR